MLSLQINTTKEKEVIDITDKVQGIIDKENVQQGLCILFVRHTTCCLTTADLDPGTDKDLLDAIEKIIPHLNYRHPHNPSHTPDHIASSIIGPSLTVPIIDGQLSLGTWQRIVVVEFSGPRTRELTVSFSG